MNTRINILKRIAEGHVNRRDLGMAGLDIMQGLRDDGLVTQHFGGQLDLTDKGRDFVTKAAEVDNSTGYEHNPMLHMISLDLRRAAYHVLLNVKNGHFTVKTQPNWQPEERVGINRLHKDGCLAMDDMNKLWVLTPLGKSTLLKLQGSLESWPIKGHKAGDGLEAVSVEKLAVCEPGKEERVPLFIGRIRPDPKPGEAIQYGPSNHVPEELVPTPDPVYTRQQCNAIAIRKVAEFRQLVEDSIDPQDSWDRLDINGIMSDAERTIITNLATQDELL